MDKLTKSLNSKTVSKEWVLIDAEGKNFGRLITEIATLLRGKHKPSFTPNVDCGDYVVVINASKVVLSKKEHEEEKTYYKHTGYFGSVKEKKFSDLKQHSPEKLFRLAARGMLPKTKLGREILKNLKVYSGSEHPHSAQIKAKQ
ncbi:MAG: 50S ribosomal protein L13 [Helicobacteraceae bacterium]